MKSAESKEITVIEVLALAALIFLSLTYNSNKNNESNSKKNQKQSFGQKNPFVFKPAPTPEFISFSANEQNHNLGIN
jgi:hypothetical protein